MSDKNEVDIRNKDEDLSPIFPTNRLRYIRRCRDLTQQQLADRIGVTQPTIGNYERRGFTQPVKPEMRRSISRALQISQHWLFDEEGYLRP